MWIFNAQIVGRGQTSLASPSTLLKMQTCRPHPRHTDSDQVIHVHFIVWDMLMQMAFSFPIP